MNTVITVIIETIVSVLANLAITLIGVAGAWLLAQISKNQQLNNINTAVGELTTAAEQTVFELQQTVVDGLKEASADGKLTQEEIKNLGKLLLEGTLQKMSDSGLGVLKAANVDINAIVTGAGEALIAKIKKGEVIYGYRLQKNWTQEDLGKRTLISNSTISLYENNARPVPADAVIAICRALDVTPNTLLGYEKPGKNKQKMLNEATTLIGNL